jgi:DNA-binding SARP family transcriptional activator
MEFRILGPLEVSRENAVIKVGGPRQQTVLAMLLLEANHVIPVDRLIRAIWDEEPPATSRGQVQICISALRRQIVAAQGPQPICSRPPGYLLNLDDGALDAHVFESGVTAARSARAAGELHRAAAEFRGALGLWRGEALSGVTSRLVQQSVAQLSERRLAVLEERLECELLLGLHHDLVGELVGLVEQHPLRERLRALLMAALYRAGRQAEALEAYRHTRDTLMEELGIEPGRELRVLHRAILNGDPAPGMAQAPAGPAGPIAAPALRRDQVQVPRLLPAAIPDFTGQETLVGRLVAKAMESGAGGDAQRAVPVSVIAGPGGAGKTTLAVHVAHQLAAHFPDGQLFARLRLGDCQASPADVLERFLRALGVASHDLPEGADERAEMYRSLLGKRKLLIVLDDAMSEQQVSALLPGSSQCSVIVTSRKRLTGLSAADRVEVRGFDHRGAVELLTRIVGAARVEAEPDTVTAVCELCGYLPLALRIAAARLAARPHWDIADLAERLADESRRLDELNHGEMGMRASIALTYESVSADARRLFRLLALVEASSFASWVGAPLLRADVLHAHDVLEELTEAYLIDTELGPGAGPARYRFHDIMRAFARERLAAEESAQDRHEALERLLGVLLYLTGEAHSREYSGDFLLPRLSGSRLPLPRPLVSRLLRNPLAWYERERLSIVAAVRQAAASGLAEHAWGLALTTVPLFESRPYLSDWRDTHEIALKAACRAGDRLGEAAMRYSLGSLHLFEGQSEQAARQLAQSHSLFQQLDDRHVAGRESADYLGECHALLGLATVHLRRGKLAAATRALLDAQDLADATGEPMVARRVALARAEAAPSWGHLQDSAAASRDGSRARPSRCPA